MDVGKVVTSSGRGYAGWGDAEEFIDYTWLGLMRGRSKTTERKDYAHYLVECLAVDDTALIKAYDESAYAIGDASSIEEVEDSLRQAKQGVGKPKDIQWPCDKCAPFDCIKGRRKGVRHAG